MVDITHKISTLRYAKAQAIVRVCDAATMDALTQKKVPKGDVFEMAKAAALLAVKRTSDTIPDCHPIPIEYTGVLFTVVGLELHIEVEVKTIYKTGVEVEAMHGASIAALTVYDMLKPLDKSIEIGSVKLLEKRGGKSDFDPAFLKSIKAAVIVCSDSVSQGKNEDRSGKILVEKLESMKLPIFEYTVIPDDVEQIRSKTMKLVKEGVEIVLFTGGTGLSPRDVTPEALRPLIEREIPGVEEAIRSYGQARMPYSMLSRSVAGLIGSTLVLALPGSTKGAEESMDAIFPHILHIFRVMLAERHD